MSHGPEYLLAEKPAIDALVAFGYNYMPPEQSDAAREGLNNVLLRPVVVDAVQRLNGVSEEVARAVYSELLGKTDNEEWMKLLRGNSSRTVPGLTTKKTIDLIDFLTPENNTFTVTRQFRVKGAGETARIADLVVFVNGIPLVVIEAKKPGASVKSVRAFDQIKQYEQQIPRLFYSNAFSIVTNGVHTRYGATAASSEHWGEWKDPWPQTPADFASRLEQDLYSLLEPGRLLDLLAHFIVFERRDEKLVKKICRYQQFRAVNRLVHRVVDEQHRRGLIWHTQGSGKSLTMVFAALKLKTHRTLSSPELESPNLLVLTDRIDLDDQIAGTFEACGLPNPVQVGSVGGLHKQIHGQSTGLTLLSTIFKFAGSTKPVPHSAGWILLVDECHRTQEKELGAFLRATFPEARFFGFTGTPIKKNDKDTYANFGAPGEGYLDRYSIDDAVADGATVPIYYVGRKTEWQIDEAKLDILFDQWFADAPDHVVAALKERGVGIADLAKHPRRVELIAYDIWTHFKENARPDGFKAQIVAIDREAVILYKRVLDRVIAEELIAEGMAEQEAWKRAGRSSACVYSASQEDVKPSEDPYTNAIRTDLVRYYLDREAETLVKAEFGKKGTRLQFLIVCNKLLTGFDAPLEAVMYLDNPLKEHNLLQAIARTNRVAGPHKKQGLVVDYIGVSRKLDEALASYRAADVQNAMRDLDVLRSALAAAHAGVMMLCKSVKRGAGGLKTEYDALVQALGTEDAWFTFRRKAREFVAAYSALAPDPAVLAYTRDLKWVAGFLSYGALHFDKAESPDLSRYSAKIRDMLEEHLQATGLSTFVKLKNITDPKFWDDFDKQGKPADELKTAAIRKSAELKKITYEKVGENPVRYEPFSERVRQAIERFEKNQIDAVELLEEMQRVAEALMAEETAHTRSGLSEQVYGLYRILEAFRPATADAAPESERGTNAGGRGPHPGVDPLEIVAIQIDGIYGSDATAPPGWHLKEQLSKELRQQVREVLHPTGLTGWKDELPARVEEYALKTYIKL
jgi:type I restriction enzyme R subunit